MHGIDFFLYLHTFYIIWGGGGGNASLHTFYMVLHGFWKQKCKFAHFIYQLP